MVVEAGVKIAQINGEGNYLFEEKNWIAPD
jgi:hypothetical protein